MILVIKSSDQTTKGTTSVSTVLIIMGMWMWSCLFSGEEICLRFLCTQKMMSHILFTPKQTGITKYFPISDGIVPKSSHDARS